jgi:hypothetical protein
MKKSTLLVVMFLTACSTTQPQVTVATKMIATLPPAATFASSSPLTSNQTQTALVQDFATAKSVIETEVAEYPRLC